MAMMWRQIEDGSEPSRSRIVKPVGLTKQVCTILKNKIFRQELRPGDRVVELRIARDLGTGQSVVREALIELEHMGFVERVPNKGTYVTQINSADAEQIDRIRIALETLAFELIVERAGTEEPDFDGPDELFAEMEEDHRRGDTAALTAHDLQFHQALWRLTGNERLCQILEALVVPIFAFYRIKEFNLPPDSALEEQTLTDHEAIIGALKDRSLEGAVQALVRHHQGALALYPSRLFADRADNPSRKRSGSSRKRGTQGSKGFKRDSSRSEGKRGRT